MERLILFDIDGTLTRTQNGFVPFNEAISKTFGIDGDIRTVAPDGNTDPMIVKDIFVKANVTLTFDKARWQQFTVKLEESYRYHLRQGTTTIRPLPGALELLQALCASEEFSASVVTGNFEVTAELKLKAAGLALYLTRGAYASDSEHRPDLPPIAKGRWEKLSGRPMACDQCIIVGDTPMDLEAARENHMKCVLVGTGRYPLEELAYWQPDACLPDLTDSDEVVKTISNL